MGEKGKSPIDLEDFTQAKNSVNGEQPQKDSNSSRHHKRWKSSALITFKYGKKHKVDEIHPEQHSDCWGWLAALVRREFQIPQSKELREGILAPIGIETNLFDYLKKWKGKVWMGPPRFPHPWMQLWAFIGSFLGISVVGLLQQYAFASMNYVLLFASLGASAVLLYSTPDSPLAQPRNLVGGHFLSGFVGITVFQLLGTFNELYWLTAALSVSIAIAVMNLTKTTHPPAGATALIAVTRGPVTDMGYLFLPFILLAVTLLLLVAIIVNNINRTARYPQYWW